MEQLNRVELIGTVSNNNITVIADGCVSHFTMATSYLYKSKDGTFVIDTSWHNVVAFSGDSIPVSLLKRLEKGTKVHVIGRLKNSRYTDVAGETRTFVEVMAKEITTINKVIDYER